MTTADQIRIERWRPDSSRLAGDLEMLAGVLHACVHAGASVSFTLPFSRDDAKAFWHDKVLPAVKGGSCYALVAPHPEPKIRGTVQLDLPTPSNPSPRAEDRKLLVPPDARRRGIAR